MFSFTEICLHSARLLHYISTYFVDFKLYKKFSLLHFILIDSRLLVFIKLNQLSILKKIILKCMIFFTIFLKLSYVSVFGSFWHFLWTFPCQSFVNNITQQL